MSNLKEIRIRITSVSSTMQITNAMKLVSAAKLKRAQDAITQMRPYAEKLQELLSNVSGNLESEVGGAYVQKRPEQRILLVALASNRGLCGAFNSNIIKEIKAQLAVNWSGKKVDVITIGKKTMDALKAQGLSIEDKNTLIDSPQYDEVSALGDEIMTDFENEKYDRVFVIYNKFRNAASQEVTLEQLLPIELPEANVESGAADYIFEPGREEIVMDLIPKTIKTQLFKAVLDSSASEHGARMTSMHKATDNADELRKELRLTYNQARQAAITKEILEIVSGAEALNG